MRVRFTVELNIPEETLTAERRAEVKDYLETVMVDETTALILADGNIEYEETTTE